ncbi:hypothetical protein PN480_03315 [Dolichospermum circinale CS-1225]|uniref:hypothetical protein n=1 Tax=Dolichospermum circinale TaxID=109265 RepID=UPI002330513F|nr:hypothetical protein [Dolichospermum circinale]MDB9520985.1 hypothetical protein [Dolichospermum circinale CS-1225]
MVNLFKHCNQEVIVDQREELKVHCIMLIEHIYQHRYAIKLLLAAANLLETIADYKANRSGNFVKKYSKQDLSDD